MSCCTQMNAADCTYAGRFDCAVCQGVEDDGDFCALPCGHAFHELCVHTWLEHSSTCPSCRAKVTRQNPWPLHLVGFESVPTALESEAAQEKLQRKQAQVDALQGEVQAKAQQVNQQLQTINELADRQEKLQRKLSTTKKQSTELEALRCEDSQRYNQLATQHQQLQEKYKRDMQRLQLQLKDEQQKERHATLLLTRLKLTNPQLHLSAIQNIAGLEQQQEGQPASALAFALAQRNKELQDAQADMQQLQEQLRQQQAKASKELQGVQCRHEVDKQRIGQQTQKHMQDALHLEYENGKLKQELATLSGQLQELQHVLLALQGPTSTQQHQQGGHHHERQQPRQLPQQHKQQQQKQQQHQQQENIDPLQHGYLHMQQPSKQVSSLCSSPSVSKLHHVNNSEACRRSIVVGDSYVGNAADDGSNAGEVLPLHQLGQIPEMQLTPDCPPACTHSMDASTTYCSGPNMGQKDGSMQYEDKPAVCSAARVLGHIKGTRPLHAAPQVPSFFFRAKHAGGGPGFVAGTGAVTGQVIRQGPDGRGSTATHLARMALNKRAPQRVSGATADTSSKKIRAVAVTAACAHSFVNKSGKPAAGQIGIDAYFGSRR